MNDVSVICDAIMCMSLMVCAVMHLHTIMNDDLCADSQAGASFLLLPEGHSALDSQKQS